MKRRKILLKSSSLLLISAIILASIGVNNITLAAENNRKNSEIIKNQDINITRNQAEEIGLNYDEIEFSNFDIDLLNSYLGNVMHPLRQGMVGIPSESLETKTFTRSQLQEMKKAQILVRDYYQGKIGENAFISGLEAISDVVLKIIFSNGRASAISDMFIKSLRKADEDEKQVMIKWATDGLNLINKALGTGRSSVKLKYMKLTWKTTGFSIITGGAIIG